MLQYSTTEGYLPLRQFIAERYRKRLGLSVSPEEILITNGSQQCLDLIGKVFIDKGDHVAIERPGYVGAIQAFSLHEPVFHPVSLNEDGPDPLMLANVLEKRPVKLFYGVPNSQNPSGITYTSPRRLELATIIGNTNTLFVEDDAYGELNFSGKNLPSMREFLPDQTIITGSFSKILAPGMRSGGSWPLLMSWKCLSSQNRRQTSTQITCRSVSLTSICSSRISMTISVKSALCIKRNATS